MKILFIRHAKSENYDVNKRQSPKSKLGIIGLTQAKLVGKRINKFLKSDSDKYYSIITSRWIRALETAEIISEETGLQKVTHPLIHEFLSNSIIANQPLDSRIVKEFEKEVAENGHNFDWRFKGKGESMRDIINRAKDFKKDLLTSYFGKNYIVVSHGLFITCFVTLIMLDDNYDDKLFKKISDMIRLENTSLTYVIYDEKLGSWQIRFLNDASHLHPSTLK